MILLKLKERTRVLHDKIERELALLTKPMSLDAYKVTLQRFWGFYFPVEARIDSKHEWKSRILDFEKRKKTTLLIYDLQALGIPAANIPGISICADLPELANFFQVLGCMYVLEGATLGGQIISRCIKQWLGLNEAHGCAFFNSYGRASGTMWKSFGDMVTSYSVTEEDEEIIMYSACETFEKLNRWLVEGNGN